ncbi:MAG TPA: response regulator [Stellaceae bacterium]|nr:response regulator [Stellaceae bacterium]
MDAAALPKPIEILYVEHDAADARATERLLRETAVPVVVKRARDGVQALAFLRRDGAYRETPRPDLILLELNLQRVNGEELLAEIKSDPDLQGIPVVILTDAERGIGMAHLLADAAIAKPLDPEELAATFREIIARRENPAAPEQKVLAELAHELRTYLNPIIAFSELMKLEIRGPLSSDYREYARGIHLSALALSRVVFEILERSRRELREAPRNSEPEHAEPAVAGPG